VAGDALDPALLVAVEAMHPAVVGRHLRLDLGVLLRPRPVAEQRGHGMAERRLQPLHDGGEVELFGKAHAGRLPPLDVGFVQGHGVCPLSGPRLRRGLLLPWPATPSRFLSPNPRRSRGPPYPPVTGWPRSSTCARVGERGRRSDSAVAAIRMSSD